MEIDGSAPPRGEDSDNKAPPDIEAMAEKAVADIEAGQDESEPMETEPTHDTANVPPASTGQTLGTNQPEVVGPTGDSAVVKSENAAALADTPAAANHDPPGGLGVYEGHFRLPTPADTAQGTMSTPAQNPPNETPGTTPGTEKKKSGKRKTSRTVRRVLVAKKEMEAATQVMTGLRDISKVLDPDDAKFLGEQFWVFTQHQLAWLIESVSPPKNEKMEVDSEPDAATAKGGEQEDEKKEPSTSPEDQTAGEHGVKMETDEISENGAGTEANVSTKSGWKARRDMLLASMAAGLKFESEKVVTAEVQTGESGEAKMVSIASREDAEKRLQEWEDKLKAINGNPFHVEDESFSLDGPLKFLIPKGFKNFLDSIDIKTLFQFLSLKKTETGALCELYALWRHTCKLSRVTAPAVVRYFLGIHVRLEGAVTAVPPCDEKKRKWMNNTIVVMTGASLEFLVEDRGIYTARDFVEARTKDLSLQLAAWREKKKLEPLKGSGKVAMISGWKAVAKEIIVMESGDGEVVPNLKLMASNDLYLEEDLRPKRPRPSEGENVTPARAKEEPSQVAKPPTPSTPPPSTQHARRTSKGGSSSKAEYDLHSKLFLEQVLGIDVTKFLALASIHTAAQLFESQSRNDETLLKAMVDAEEAKDLESASLILKAWVQKLKVSLETANTPKKKGRPQGKAIKPETLKDANDPYDLMSDVTKKFLATMDIHDAEKFLSTRTTEIAAEFVKFRKRQGMVELKGLGSIASVSGWKANCRRFARAMGREDLANLEPAEKSTSTTKRSVPLKAAIIQSSESSTPGFTVTHPGILYGKSRRMFAVQGESEIPMQFRFDVSLRNDDSGPGLTLFLTYKGSGPSIRSAKVPRIPLAETDEKIPLLVDTTLTKSGDNDVDSRALFETKRPGCGLVELQKYGVRPLKEQDLSGFKKALQSFIDGSAVEMLPPATQEQKFNVTLRRRDIDKCQYLAIVGTPMQAGQTMALVFPSIDSFLVKSVCGGQDHNIDRGTLLSALFLASSDDLGKVVDFLTDEVVASVSFDTDDFESLKRSTKAVQRVDYISRRIFAQGYDDLDSKKDKLTLSYQRLKGFESVKKLSDEDYDKLARAIRLEISEGFMSLIENDTIIGMKAREKWCQVAKETFDESIETILSTVSLRGTHEYIDIKSLLTTIFRRAVELSVDSTPLSKLAFAGNPLDGPTDSTEDKKIVICPAPSAKTNGDEVADSEPNEYKPVPLDEMKNSTDESGFTSSADVSFYRVFLAKIIIKIVNVFGKILDSEDFAASDLIESWKLGDVVSPEARALIAAPWHVPVSVPSDPIASLQPQTEQFFLGIVWPVLREFGWRIEVQNFPSERSFVAPKWKGDQQKLGKLAKLAKTHRDRRRQNLAREVNQIGFGALSKLTKRLFVASGGMSKDSDSLGKPIGGRKVLTVQKICDKFIESIEAASATKDDDVIDRVKDITSQVIACFDSLAPRIQSTSVERGSASEKYGADVFMQFLLVLPALLGRSEVELQEMNDSLELIHELTAFMMHNYSDLFPPSLRPPQEIYMTKGKRVPSSLLSRLERKLPSGSNKNTPDELTEVLWDEDAEELSDFVVNVMSQTIACRATEADVARKFRRIHVGYPGVVCRHCMGEGGEGRYFFTTIESLTTLSTVFEKHIMKCAFVPADIKKSVVTARSKHAEQRKAFPNGAQQAYFNRLWDRLRSMKIAGTTSSSAVPLPKASGSAAAMEESPELSVPNSDEKMTFEHSLDVLDFIRTSTPWKGTKDIEEALNQYYNCLDYGGRIYQTKSMPEHFSSAWLLNKVVPRRTRTAAKRYLPG